ncbi:MAG: hypothetical protein ACUVX8_05705 [Candidatus Zipacnadales bacterium]
MPTGSLNYPLYREIIPDIVFHNRPPSDEVVAGALKTSQEYASGLMVAVYHFGEGRLVVNTLLIRDNLGTHPMAEKLLRNMLNCAAKQ